MPDWLINSCKELTGLSEALKEMGEYVEMLRHGLYRREW